MQTRHFVPFKGNKGVHPFAPPAYIFYLVNGILNVTKCGMMVAHAGAATPCGLKGL